MSIYGTTGIINKRYKNIKTNMTDFNYLLQVKPQVERGEIAEVKKSKAKYFLSGELLDNTRKDENMINKSLLVLDYDNISISVEEFKKAIHDKLSDYNYFLYPTISHTVENPRYRLILEPTRAFIASESKRLISRLISLIGLPCDKASETYSQHMGLPIVVNGSLEEYVKEIVINQGKPYPIDALLQVVEIEEMEQLDKPKNKVKALNPKSTYATMQAFCQREESNLHEYSYYINCILVLAKAVQQGEISKENGFRYAEMLALDNEEWKKSSLEDIEREISNSNLKTDVTFMQRFSKNGEQDPLLDTLECATQLLAEKYFLVIGTDDDAPLYLYDESKGIYTHSSFYMQKIIYEKENRYNEYNIRDVVFKIKMKCERKRAENNRYLIPVANGIYDLQQHNLLPFSPDYVFTNSIVTNYVENAPKPSKMDVDKWLLSIADNDEDIVKLLWQVIAECLNGNYTRGKYFILTGDGNNGKGTFQQLLINLIGLENVSSLKMKKIGERFAPYGMVGKTLNIGDDIEGTYIEDNSNVQSIATGDTITVEQKGKDPFSVQLKLAMVFSANEIPKVRNKTNGTYRRMTIIPFNADFSGQIEDRSIKDEKIHDKEVLEYILNKALQVEFTKFIEPDVVKQRLEDYKQSNDPILEFYTTYLKEADTDRFPIPFIYQHYKIFCDENGFKPVSTRNFTTGIGDYFGKGWDKTKARVTDEFQNSDYCSETNSLLNSGYMGVSFDFGKVYNSYIKK
ncbi:phage/plasmid primase, P4 family [Desemzia sp. FAM 23991]|uniref:DNA primase family protein n=1 Tax=Desemzia sp. FAM 23991 TaxID=3259521 RepID=UPI00388A4A69